MGVLERGGALDAQRICQGNLTEKGAGSCLRSPTPHPDAEHLQGHMRKHVHELCACV